ncbi:MAG: hypothetical protein GXO47_01545 [Chlorobi bacterium]|nr:hypothetical protein [Chlorobiota bacterium]
MVLFSKFSQSLVSIGIFIFIIGLIALLFPVAFGEATIIILGILFFIGGVLRLSFAIFSFSTGTMALKYLASILMIIAGIWLISNPDIGLNILTVFMAVYFIADGISSVSYSFTMIPVSGGSYLLAEGIISIILGILIWAHWPASGKFALSVYVGIKLLFNGLALVMTGKLLKKPPM